MEGSEVCSGSEPGGVIMTPEQQDARRCIQRLKNRLEKWELSHLRELAAKQAEQIEELQAKLASAEREAFNADRACDMYRDLLTEPIGITQQGQLFRLPTTHLP